MCTEDWGFAASLTVGLLSSRMSTSSSCFSSKYVLLGVHWRRLCKDEYSRLLVFTGGKMRTWTRAVSPNWCSDAVFVCTVEYWPGEWLCTEFLCVLKRLPGFALWALGGHEGRFITTAMLRQAPRGRLPKPDCLRSPSVSNGLHSDRLLLANTVG